MKKQVYVLHQYGAPRHFESLLHLAEERHIQVIQIEFTIFRRFVKSIITLNFKLFGKSCINLWYLIFFMFSKNKTIIVGVAPYDIFIFYLSLIRRKHTVIYYTSWPYWDLSNYPRAIFLKSQLKMWINFLRQRKIVAVTPEVEKGLKKYSDDIIVIPHCVNTRIFNVNQMVKKESEDTNNIRIIFVGRLIEEKGINIIINVIKKLNFSKKFEWWFVGEGILKNKIKRLDETNKSVRYFGKIDNQQKLANLYNQCDILLLPSIHSKGWEELFGIVLIEAMSCGVVPISSDCVGPRTVIDNGLNGFILKENNEENIIDDITYLENSRNKLAKMSKSASEKAAKKYSIVQTSKLWAKVLELD